MLHAVLQQYAFRKADTIIPYTNPYMNTFQRMSGPLSFQGQSVFHQPAAGCTNHTSMLYLHHPFIFDKSVQQPLPPPLFYAPPQALPTEKAMSQTCADPRQQSMCPKLLNNLHTKIEWEKMALVTRDWHKSSNNKSHVLLHSYRGSTRILQLNFKGLFFSPSSGFRLSCLHFLVKQLTSTLKHLHAACCPSTICFQKSWHNYSIHEPIHEHVSTYEWPPSFQGKSAFHQPAAGCTNHTSMLYLHHPFMFDKSVQQPLPPPLFYAPPQALPTEEAMSQTCADPSQPSMYPKLLNNLHTKIEWEKLALVTRDSWLVTDTNQATTSRMSVCTATVAALASYNWISKASSSALLLASACLACTLG